MAPTNTIEVASISRALTGRLKYTFTVHLADGRMFSANINICRAVDEFIFSDKRSEQWNEARDIIVRSVIDDYTSPIIYK